MSRLLPLAFSLLVLIALPACSDDVLTTSDPGSPGVSELDSASWEAAHHHGILSTTSSRANRRPAHSTAFVSPLFGLATAPNGDVLVADAGTGVSTRNGRTDFPLPGVSDLDPLGRGTVWATKGLTGAPGEDTGQGLYRLSRGTARPVADLYAFEAANNPDGADVPDSNPFDVQSLGGQAALVVDAGANALLRIDNQGAVEVIAVFPNEVVSTANVKALVGCPEGPPNLCALPPQIPAQAVPTSIAIGPDGYYYVGELKGFPAPVGESNIWRISPQASQAACGSSPDCVKAFDGGFTSIIDLAIDASGTLHVAEFDEDSWFAVEALGAGSGGSINACSLAAGTCDERATGIPQLTALTFDRTGTLWYTKNALTPGAASVNSLP